MKSKEEESVMRTFIGQTRDLSECSKCTSLLLDPVEAKCGHYFCRGCITELPRNSTGEQTLLCGVCQTIVCKDDLKELNPKMSKITSSLQHFLQDFCREGGWKIDTLLSSSANGQPISRSLPLNLEGKKSEKTVVSRTTAADIEEGSGSVFICSSSSSELAHQSTLEPEHKVQQWLMTNPNVDPLAVPSEDDGENPSIKSSRTLSKALSFESKTTSKLVFTPVDISSSTGKESSYDIVSAPSPPPSREIPQQMKRGRGGRGRGRGRTRKNALPISSGEPPAKKRGRSAGNTPETKPTTSTTPKGEPDSSPELDNTTASKAPSIATIITPLTRSSKPPIEIPSRIERSKDSRNENSSHIGEEERNISISIGNSCALPTNEAPEKSSDTSARLVDVCEPYLNCVSDVRCITPRPFESVLADRSNIHVLQPVSAPSPQLDKPVSVPSTAYHTTPVSRPRARNSLGSAIHDLQTSDRDFRRHSISEELRSGTGRRNVNFFHKGRIVPGKPITSFKKQQIVFTRLGKLGPFLDLPPACPPVSVHPPVHAQKCFEDKETQTFPPAPLSFSLVSTQTEPVVASVNTPNKESNTDHPLMNNQTLIVPDKAPSIDSVLKSLDAQLRDENILVGEPDVYSEDLFMSAEPFKRARVLSSSDSDGDKMETKRKKPCPSVKSVDTDGPISSMSHSADGATTANVPQRLSPQQASAKLASKTVVMESDPEEDDVLVATPPQPPTPKPVPCKKKVLTCSGLPRPQVKMVEDWARRVGAEISLTYSSAVTHIIVQVDEENCAQRTLKFLYGVASGKWIIGIDWIHQCIRETRLIDEEPFEALDMDGEDGPRRARQTSQRSKLFEAFEFCCQEPFTDVSVEQLNELLMLCGAVTVNSPAELTKNRRHSMIIVQTDDDVSPAVQRKAASWFERLQVLSVSREWVLDCLASYQLLPVRSQLIGKHSESMLRMMAFDSHLLA